MAPGWHLALSPLGDMAMASWHSVVGDGAGGDQRGHPHNGCWGWLYQICSCHVPSLSSLSFTSDERDPKRDPKLLLERSWSGKDMGEGLGAWWGEVCVCCGDILCFLLSQQQQLQTFGLMGLGSI